jgi:hypothetical protein
MATRTNTSTVEFPIVVEARDYHEFGEKAAFLNILLATKVHYTEVKHAGNGVREHYPYIAVFYLDRTPDVVKLINELNTDI